MSFGYLLEIFGGTGAVILGVGTCIYGFCKTHEFKYDYDEEDKLDPIDVLNEEWESPGEDFPIEEHFGSNWSRQKFAKKENGNWTVNINKKEGITFKSNSDTEVILNGFIKWKHKLLKSS